MRREDFIFTIGFQGDAAIVDRQARSRYGTNSTRELAERGLFRAAFSSALFSKSEEEMREFIEIFNRSGGGEDRTPEQCKRLFGIYDVPEENVKVVLI